MKMCPLAVLLLADDRPGHYHLSEGVIAALRRTRPVAVHRLEVTSRGWVPRRALAALLRAGVPPARVLSLGYACEPDATARPDLIVSAGGETLVANAAFARLTGAPNLFCGSLRHLPPEAFSLIVSSYARHASLPRHVVTLKPSGIDPSTLDRPAERLRFGSASPPKLAGLLLGGDSGHFRYQQPEWESLLRFLRKSQMAHGTRWIVSTSRRSPPELARSLAGIAAEADTPVLELIDFHTAGPGTLPKLFARAEAILCTEDSSTMISEAVCAQLPVVGVSPAIHGFKDEERQYREFMRRQGWCRFVPLAELSPERFLAELACIEPLRENHLDSLARVLRERLPQLFS